MTSQKRATRFVVLGLLAAALIAAGSYLYPYLRLPDDPPEVLEEYAETGGTLVREVRARPRDDVETVITAVNAINSMLEAKSKKLNHPAETECPLYPPKRLSDEATIVDEIVDLAKPVQDAVFDKFAVYSEMTIWSRGLIKAYPRNIALAWCHRAIREADSGRVSSAVTLILDALKMSRGAIETPDLDHLGIGIGLEEITHKAIFRLLPVLSGDQRNALAAELRARPDAVAMFLNALRVDAFVFAEYSANARKGHEHQREKPLSGPIDGFLRRERLTRLAAMKMLSEAYDNWVHEGSNLPPPRSENILAALKARSPFGMTSLAWVDTLLDLNISARYRTNAVIDALVSYDDRRDLRPGDPNASIDYYNSRIVFRDGNVCIERD
ncbi:MAG: hypothetical protein M5R36_18615 [Deltaproteobacteria bacterium]|nr:hypothetical protein [Deltaproteobacteria bacterium]